MTGNSHKVFIGGEQRKSVLTACRRDQEIDRAGIDSFGAAHSPQASGGNIGLSIQFKERVRVEESQQAVELFRGPQPIEEFLKNIADQKVSVAGFKVPAKRTDVGIVFIDPRPSQHQRPYGRVNDQVHDRDGLSCSPIFSGIRSYRAP
jgi:hypothetical protein